MDLKALLRANADRVVAVGLVLAGAVVIILGWVGVSGTGLAAQQIPYLVSGGLGGIVLVIVGCTAWVSADLQDEWRQLEAIERRLADVAETPTAVKGRPSAGGRDRSRAGRLGRGPVHQRPLPPEAPQGERAAAVSDPGRRTVPWSLSDARLAAGSLAVGGVLLAWGWWVASGRAKVGDAVPGIAIGVVATVVVIGGALSWVSSGRRSIAGRRLWSVADLQATARLLPATDWTDDVAGVPGASTAFLTLPGTSRYHREGCLLVLGKPGRAGGVSALPAGLTACEMCQP